jgi:hypothetical protein
MRLFAVFVYVPSDNTGNTCDDDAGDDKWGNHRVLRVKKAHPYKTMASADSEHISKAVIALCPVMPTAAPTTEVVANVSIERAKPSRCSLLNVIGFTVIPSPVGLVGQSLHSP